jgi:hypothetical protein
MSADLYDVLTRVGPGGLEKRHKDLIDHFSGGYPGSDPNTTGPEFGRGLKEHVRDG